MNRLIYDSGYDPGPRLDKGFVFLIHEDSLCCYAWYLCKQGGITINQGNFNAANDGYAIRRAFNLAKDALRIYLQDRQEKVLREGAKALGEKGRSI